VSPAKAFKTASKPLRVSDDVAESYQVRFEVHARLSDEVETNVVMRVRGQIVHVSDEDTEVVAGTFRGMCVSWTRFIDCGENYVEVFDQDGEVSEMTSLVWDLDKDTYRSELGLSAEDKGDLIVPLTMEILPEHRGKGVGLLVLWRFLDYFGKSASLAVLKPYPLNHNAEAKRQKNYLPMQYDRLSKVPLKKGIAKIGQHWKRLGFKPIPKSLQAGRRDDDDYLYLDMPYELPLRDLIARSS